MDDYAATFGMFHEDCSQGSSFASGSWRVGSGSIPYATFSILTAASDIVISLAVICTLCLARNVELPAELCWQSAFLCMITLGLLALHSRVYAMEILHDSSSQIRILSVWLGCIGGLCVPLILWVSRTPEAMAFFRWEILLLLGLATVLGFAHYGYRNLAILGLRRQAITQSVAIIGASEDTSRAIRLIRERCIGVTVRAIYDDQPISLDHAFEGVRVAGSLVDLLNDHQHDPLEWAVIVTNGNERERIATLKDRLIAGKDAEFAKPAVWHRCTWQARASRTGSRDRAGSADGCARPGDQIGIRSDRRRDRSYDPRTRPAILRCRYKIQ